MNLLLFDLYFLIQLIIQDFHQRLVNTKFLKVLHSFTIVPNMEAEVGIEPAWTDLQSAA